MIKSDGGVRNAQLEVCWSCYSFSAVFSPATCNSSFVPCQDIASLFPGPPVVRQILGQALAAEVQKVSRSVVVLNKAGGNGAISAQLRVDGP